MKQVTDIEQVKADLAGTFATQLSLVVEHLDAVIKYYHHADHGKKWGKITRIRFEDCHDDNCGQARLLIHNTRRLIEQGV